ncbi:MAG: GTPase HflX [Candidatus Sericytochromatia bacterium]|nr:GTPase HflX [Candidatus Sericytochromatia bacterium]
MGRKQRDTRKEFFETVEVRPRAILIGVQTRGQERPEVEEHLDEMAQLATTDGMDVVGRVIQSRARPDPATFLGSGKVEEVMVLAEEQKADWLLFDDELTPGQQRNLEKQAKVKVMDRTGLILDIFAMRARTREARTQVELAQHEYMLPRLTGLWTHFTRQKGGTRTRGGEGESQLEIDRRIVKARIAALKRELGRIGRQAETRLRGHDGFFRVALVGYTNAGKSSLLNALTRAGVLAEDKLFATLDATTRRWSLATGRDALLTDTVGFIRKLPHQLVASFRSTLAEAAEADLLLHIVDLSHPAWAEHMAETRSVLTEIGAGDRPEIVVFNKVDRPEAQSRLEQAREDEPGCVPVSAASGEGLKDLRAVVEAQVAGPPREGVVHLPAGDRARLSEIYRRVRVVKVEDGPDGGLQVTVHGPPGELVALGVPVSQSDAAPEDFPAAAYREHLHDSDTPGSSAP